MRVFGLFALILCSSCTRHDADHARWLVIEVPTRAGAEKASIQGTAKPPPILDEPALLVIVARCGAVDPSFKNGLSDLMQITSRSSSNDYDVVSCVKRSIGVDFDAFVASGEPNHLVDYDEAPFASLASKS